MSDFTDLLNWAFERHQNIMSWYIRPLFLFPFAYFAYKRSGWGIALTVLGLITSMAWFPVPAEPNPMVASFLQSEKDFLLAPMHPKKALFFLLVIGSLTLLARAFWLRSWKFGFALLLIIPITKVVWSITDTTFASGQSTILPGLLGIVAAIVALGLFLRLRK